MANKLQCPKCERNDFANNRLLGLHLWKAHNIPGKSTSSKYTRKMKKEKVLGKKELKHKTKSGRRVVSVSLYGQRKEEEIRLQNHISYSYGYCKAWLQIQASNAGIPEHLLAERVGELLQDTRIRTKSNLS